MLCVCTLWIVFLYLHFYLAVYIIHYISTWQYTHYTFEIILDEESLTELFQFFLSKKLSKFSSFTFYYIIMYLWAMWTDDISNLSSLVAWEQIHIDSCIFVYSVINCPLSSIGRGAWLRLSLVNTFCLSRILKWFLKVKSSGSDIFSRNFSFYLLTWKHFFYFVKPPVGKTLYGLNAFRFEPSGSSSVVLSPDNTMTMT